MRSSSSKRGACKTNPMKEGSSNEESTGFAWIQDSKYVSMRPVSSWRSVFDDEKRCLSVSSSDHRRGDGACTDPGSLQDAARSGSRFGPRSEVLSSDASRYAGGSRSSSAYSKGGARCARTRRRVDSADAD